MRKIVSFKRLLLLIQNFKKLGKKVVLVTGCFDILHPAHRQFLKKAKKEGDILIVGLETDKRVQQLKGKNRPVNSWQIRAKNLSKVLGVDLVFALPEDINKPEIQKELLWKIKPDILAVSSHTDHLKEKKSIIEMIGGKLKIVMNYDPRFSTSKLIAAKKIKRG